MRGGWLRVISPALSLAFVIAATCGCQTVRRSPSGAGVLRADVVPSTESATNAPPAKKFQKWNPVWWFGNADDPEPPDWYRPGSPNRRFLWYLRNPFHNFTFYVIGIADRHFPRSGRFPDDVMSPGGGWNFAVSRCGGWLPLPFVSFNGKWVQSYFGWRPRGNFGAKFNVGKRYEPPPVAPEAVKPPG